MTTEADLAKMTLPEKVRSYAKDVLATETQNGDRFQYSFLFSCGVGYIPMGILSGRATDIGKLAVDVATKLHTTIHSVDFKLASFGTQLTEDSIYEAFYSFFEKSDGLKLRDEVQNELNTELEVVVEQGVYNIEKEEWEIPIKLNDETITTAIFDSLRNLKYIPSNEELASSI